MRIRSPLRPLRTRARRRARVRSAVLTLATLAPFGLTGCSEPELEFHLAQRPGQSGPVESPPCAAYDVLESECRFLSGPTTGPPCRDCVARSWVGYTGEEIELQIDRRPFLRVAASELDRPEIHHTSLPYPPICELFSLSFRRRIPPDSAADAESNYPGLSAAAVLHGQVIAAGQDMINGETVTLRFPDRESAERAARELGLAPSFRPEDPALREERRREGLAFMDEMLSDEDTRRSFARRVGVPIEELDRDLVASKLLCP